MNIEIWHNLLWSPYKAQIFGALWGQARSYGDHVHVFQIARTDASRRAFATIDRSKHNYDYDLIFDGSLDDICRVRRMWACIRRVVNTRADVVVLAGYDQPEYWMQLLILRIRRKPVAVFCDSTLFDRPHSRIKSFAKKVFFSNVQGVFCYGERSRELALSYGAPAARVFVDCQAAHLPETYRVDEVVARRVAARDGSGPPRFLFVGRLAPEKRVDDLIHAFARTLETLKSGELIIVGSGGEMNRLVQLSHELGVTDRITFRGPLAGEALWDEYRRASCLILPSSSEPWGLVVNEALAAGCPALVSDRCGCVPELIRDGETGFVFGCTDLSGLKSVMLQAVSRFSNVEATADACLRTVSRFTPVHAADQIHRGLHILGRDDKRYSRSAI